MGGEKRIGLKKRGEKTRGKMSWGKNVLLPSTVKEIRNALCQNLIQKLSTVVRIVYVLLSDYLSILHGFLLF